MIVVCKHYYLEVIYKQLKPVPGVSLWSVNITSWTLSGNSLDPSYYLEVIYKQLRPQPDALLGGGYLQTAYTQSGTSLWSVNITTWMLFINSLDPRQAHNCGL